MKLLSYLLSSIVLIMLTIGLGSSYLDYISSPELAEKGCLSCGEPAWNMTISSGSFAQECVLILFGSFLAVGIYFLQDSVGKINERYWGLELDFS